MLISRLAIAAALGTTAHAVMAQPEVWDLIGRIGVEEVITKNGEETIYEVRKTFPEALAKGSLDVEITGYAVPALPGEAIRELILVSDMRLCPLCGSAEHGASLQVTLADPIQSFDESRRLTLRGQLTPVTDPETWQAATLANASIVTD